MTSKLPYCLYSLLFFVSAAFGTDIPDYPFAFVPPTDRAAIEAELLAEAIQSARSQADKLAEPLGRHVSAAAADDLLVPATISMSATVNVLFKMD